jgi:hypothetical protein
LFNVYYLPPPLLRGEKFAEENPQKWWAGELPNYFASANFAGCFTQYPSRITYWKYIVGPWGCLQHCKEDPIYAFPEMKLRGLVPSFHIHVSVSDLYIPWIGPPILLQKNRQTDPENI